MKGKPAPHEGAAVLKTKKMDGFQKCANAQTVEEKCVGLDLKGVEKMDDAEKVSLLTMNACLTCLLPCC